MANTFEKTAPITRDHVIEGYPCRIFIDADGIRIQRKGDRSRDKKAIAVPWGTVMEVGAEKAGVNAYEHLGFDE